MHGAAAVKVLGAEPDQQSRVGRLAGDPALLERSLKGAQECELALLRRGVLALGR